MWAGMPLNRAQCNSTAFAGSSEQCPFPCVVCMVAPRGGWQVCVEAILVILGVGLLRHNKPAHCVSCNVNPNNVIKGYEVSISFTWCQPTATQQEF